MHKPAVAPQSTASTPRHACQATTKSGAACRAFALPGRPFCLTHDPECREDATAARVKGAGVSNRLRSIEGRRRKLDSAPELVMFTSTVIQDLLSGSVTVDVGRAVLYGVSIQRSLLEASDLDTRLRALEAAQPPNAAKKEAPPWRA